MISIEEREVPALLILEQVLAREQRVRGQVHPQLAQSRLVTRARDVGEVRLAAAQALQLLDRRLHSGDESDGCQ